MTKEERLLRQEQRERAKAIEAAAREAGRGPLDLPYLLLVLTLVGVGLIMLFSASFPSAYYEEGNPAYYLIRQGIFAILGITAMFIVGKINYERYRAARSSSSPPRLPRSALSSILPIAFQRKKTKWPHFVKVSYRMPLSSA